MALFRKYFFLFFITLGSMNSSTLSAVYTTPDGQKMIEESNKIYSGNKYNIPPQDYSNLKQARSYTQGNTIYYNSYPYYYNTPVYPYYGYYGSPPPPSSSQAFPDDAEADALYRYLQSR